MLALLQIIDNPLQDIPLVAVLRSRSWALRRGIGPDSGGGRPGAAIMKPWLRPRTLLMQHPRRQLHPTPRRLLRPPMNEEASDADADSTTAIVSDASAASDSACIASDTSDTADADSNASVLPRQTRRKIQAFLEVLPKWRTLARRERLTTLLWEIWQQTGYFDYVGGMPGGAQRQANLRLLQTWAGEYESTAFRGLFHFLRFCGTYRKPAGTGEPRGRLAKRRCGQDHEHP